jgi:hypothetical protein
MASGSGVRGEEESGKSTPLIPSVKSITISSLGKDSQRMKNIENSDTTKDFIARDGCAILPMLYKIGGRQMWMSSLVIKKLLGQLWRSQMANEKHGAMF